MAVNSADPSRATVTAVAGLVLDATTEEVAEVVTEETLDEIVGVVAEGTLDEGEDGEADEANDADDERTHVVGEGEGVATSSNL
jgi:hypothetical protein